jgi:hypothetical protein
MVNIRVAQSFGAAALLSAVCLTTSCSRQTADEPAQSQEPPYRLSEEDCDNLVEIRTETMHVEDIAGPSKAQQALDAASPADADLSRYVLNIAIEQSFENLLDRPLIIEEASATLEDSETGSSYQSDYDLAEPLELAAHETRRLMFHVSMPADRMSPSAVLGILEGAALGMTLAPEVLITVPNSDNCGYPEGMRVKGKRGTVEVRRPVTPGPLDDLFNGILKGVLHNL